LTGSLLLLVGILALHVEGGHTFDIIALQGQTYSSTAQWWMFLAFFLAFAIKMPMLPFHTWLPDAHAEAPTAGSVILAGVLLKMGGYGFLRFCLPMFLAVGQLYDRTHSRMIQDYGGLHKQMPRFVALFFLFSVASFGLPGTCSFIGEFLVLLGASEVSFVMVLLAMGGIVLAASYMLWMLQRVALGQPATRTASLLPDLTVREMVTLVPLAMIVLWIGVYPAPMLEMINASVANLVPATK